MIAEAAADRSARRRKLEEDLRCLDFEGTTCPSESVRTEWARARQFRLSLERMGPLFAAFGRYLATRLDLVSGALAAELAAIPDAAPPVSASGLFDMYSRELGCPVELAFRALAREPFQARLFRQAHRGVLGDTEVIIEFVPPEISRRISDSEFLNLFEPPLAKFGVDPACARRAITDFQRQISALQTWDTDRNAWNLLAADTERFKLVGAPELYPHLCTTHVVVWRRWRSLDALSGGGPDAAQALCTAWLLQALHLSVFPVEVRPENAGFGADGRIVFPCGPFAALPDVLKASLWKYLLAVAADDADLAATHLAAAMAGDLTGWQSERLRRRFRQAAPLNDSFLDPAAETWLPDGRLAAQVLIHWRIANESNLMNDALITFHRGLFATLKTASTLAPGRDWLAEALRNVRLLMAFDEMKQAVRPSQVKAWIESNSEALVGLPERLDRALTYGSTNVHRVGAVPPVEHAENRRVRSLCLLLVLAGAGFLLHKIEISTGAGVPGITPVVFFVLGMLLLRVGLR